MFKLNHYPQSFKIAKVVPIFKPGKNAQLPCSYRPISLLSCISKIFEKVIHFRLSKILQKNKTINNCQFGFRPKHNTTQQLARIVNDIQINYNKDKVTTMALLDIKKAFDRVWIDGLIYKRIHYKIPKSLILLIHSYLTNRELLVQLKNTQSTRKLIAAGVPQGSILGPTLFNIFINDIPIFAKTNTALYADDTAIYASSFSDQIASKQIQIHINLLEKFYDKWKIKINAEKTQQIIFTRKFTDHKIWDKLRVYDNKITDEPHVKYLGTYIDTRLNFFKNTKYLISKASAALKNMYSLMNRNSKLTPQNKVLMYKTIFRPILTYAAPVWCHLSDTAFKPLEVFQNKCLRLALNESRYARIVDLQERSATTSLRAFVNKLSNNFYSHQLNFNKLTRRITKFRSYNTPFRLKHKLSYQHLSIYDK
ncbi:putative RNA-directed DNA polymerase from transposon X-element-like Protein [Tribolium castaneum]|uniref:Putative RNA-directed DNA polymerase from transposon X-element-like Protein n=1 Tax=Tribolium castaneum TaxID=7070 RepID=D7GY19_TRICA|nr:putative RNA-directed DNA polymerase from transposon X-element-like Protein [Tribolium castaneum]